MKTIKMEGGNIILKDNETGEEQTFSLSKSDRSRVNEIFEKAEEGFWKDFYKACNEEGIISNETRDVLEEEKIETLENFRATLKDYDFYQCKECDVWSEDFCDRCNKCRGGCCECVYCEFCQEDVNSDDYDSEWNRCLDCLGETTSYCDECDCRFENDELEYNEDEDRSYCRECSSQITDRGLLRYHSEGDEKESDNQPFKFGVEIEKEDENFNGEETFSNVPYGWRCEEDGSLSNKTGFELVSPSFTSSKSLIDSVKKSESLQKMINADYSDCCGGHIRISSNILGSANVLHKGSVFIYFLYIFYEERKKRFYCEFKTLEDLDFSGNKYQSLKFENGNRIEWRLFPAVKNTDCLFLRVKLMEEFYISMIGNIPITLEWIEENKTIQELAVIEGKNLENIFRKLKSFEESRENLINFLKN